MLLFLSGATTAVPGNNNLVVVSASASATNSNARQHQPQYQCQNQDRPSLLSKATNDNNNNKRIWSRIFSPLKKISRTSSCDGAIIIKPSQARKIFRGEGSSGDGGDGNGGIGGISSTSSSCSASSINTDGICKSISKSNGDREQRKKWDWNYIMNWNGGSARQGRGKLYRSKGEGGDEATTDSTGTGSSSDSSLPFLFMSENEEEEEIIRALSMSSTLQSDDDNNDQSNKDNDSSKGRNDDDDDFFFYEETYSSYFEYDEEKELQEEIKEYFYEPRAVVQANPTKLNSGHEETKIEMKMKRNQRLQKTKKNVVRMPATDVTEEKSISDEVDANAANITENKQSPLNVDIDVDVDRSMPAPSLSSRTFQNVEGNDNRLSTPTNNAKNYVERPGVPFISTGSHQNPAATSNKINSTPSSLSLGNQNRFAMPSQNVSSNNSNSNDKKSTNNRNTSTSSNIQGKSSSAKDTNTSTLNPNPRAQNFCVQRKNTKAHFPKGHKMPIDIPSSIEAIRYRAASNSLHVSKLSQSSQLFTPQQQRGRQQQQQQQQQNIYRGNNQTSMEESKLNFASSSKISTSNNNRNANSNNKKKQQLPLNPKTQSKKTKHNTLPTTMSLTTPWARKFILSRPKDALLPIPREFLTDGFNLVQLAPIVERVVRDSEEGGNAALPPSPPSSPYPSLYKAALRLILEETENHPNPAGSLSSNHNTNGTKRQTQSTFTQSQIQKAAEVLYTLVHARYISSPRGLDTIRRMFLRNYEVGTDEVFGKCPRMNCAGTPLLPFGISDGYDIDGDGGICRKSMRYCCCCGEVSLLSIFVLE